MTFPLIETLLFSLFDTLQYYIVTNKLSNGHLKTHIWHIPVIVLCAIVAGASSYLIEGVYSYIVGTCALIVLSWILYKRSGFQLAYLHIVAISIVMSLQLFIIFCVDAFLGEIEYTAQIGMSAQLIGMVLAYITARYLPLQLLFRFVETKNDLFRVVSLNIFIVLSVCVLYWYMQFDGILENMILISAIVVIILLINVVFLREGLKNHGLEQQVRAYELYMPIVSELMDEIRIKQHDFDNHIAALKGVLVQHKGDRETLDRVEEYLNEQESTFKNVDLLKMNNRIIAGFLYSKMKESIDKRIRMDIRIEDYSFETEMLDCQVLDILSILVDNAFETNIPDNHVFVRFYKENERSVIEVANKHSYIPHSRLEGFFTKGYSEKNPQNRGLGLYKLEKIVTENRGEIEVSNFDFEDNYLVFKIVLP